MIRLLLLLAGAPAWAGPNAPPAEKPPATPVSRPRIAPPAVEACPEVAYPEGLDRGAQQVDLLLELDEHGRVTAVLEADGEPPFVDLARDAARRCAFTPATEDGAPIAVQVPFSWHFPEPPVRLRGVVRTRHDRAPVGGVAVRVGGRTVTTDADGTWTVRGLPDGPLVVSLADPRYRMSPLEVDLGDDEALSLDLWVDDGAAENEIVGVYEGGPRDRWALTPEEVRATPGSLGDPIRALHSRPGLARTPFDAGWLLVRGGDHDDTGQFLDGVRMPLLFHLGGFTSVLHPEMTETVRYRPGLAPPRYQGNAGAADVIPRAPGDERRVVAGVNTVFAHAFAEVPLGDRAGLAFAARRSYLDGVLTAVLGPERARIAPRFWDGQAHLRVGDTDLMVLGLSDTFDAPTLEGDVVTVGQEGFQVQGRARLALGAGSLTVAPWYAIHARSITGMPDAQRVVERFPGVRVEAASAPEAPVQALGGGEAELRTFVLTTGPDLRSAPALSAAPYASIAAGDRVRLETGLRLDTLLVRGHLPRAGLSPRASLRWRASDALTVVAEIGRTHQAPTSTLLVGVPEGAYLPLERVDAVASGLELSRPTWSAAVQGYQRILHGVAGIERDGSIGTSSGRARGIEADVRWAPGPLDLTVLYQLGRSELVEDEGDEPLPRPFDATHRFEVLALLELPRAWTVSGRFRLTSGFPRHPGSPPTPTQAYDLLTLRFRDLGLADTDLRLPAFHALDLKVARTFTFRGWELDAWLDVQNVYGRRVAEPLLTGFDESEPSYGFGLPILPIFGVEGRFDL